MSQENYEWEAAEAQYIEERDRCWQELCRFGNHKVDPNYGCCIGCGWKPVESPDAEGRE